jgi:hypothetical protein
MMDLIDYIYDECHRQHVTNYGDFATGWQIAKDRESVGSWQEFAIFVMRIARAVDYANLYRNGEGENLRTSHVGFMQGGSAAPAGEVRERFDRWCEFMHEYVGSNLDGPIQDRPDDEIVDRLIKTLLDIHPWADGNGRTASILRNWMLGQLDDPSPLPYYYGEPKFSQEADIR